MAKWRETRKAAGVSLHKASAQAGVTPTTARAFELGGPEAILDAAKRSALLRVYAAFEGSNPSAPQAA